MFLLAHILYWTWLLSACGVVILILAAVTDVQNELVALVSRELVAALIVTFFVCPLLARMLKGA